MDELTRINEEFAKILAPHKEKALADLTEVHDQLESTQRMINHARIEFKDDPSAKEQLDAFQAHVDELLPQIQDSIAWFEAL